MRNAQMIMGENLISPEEISTLFKGVIYTPEQLNFLEDTIPNVRALEFANANNYFLFPGPNTPMTLTEVNLLTRGDELKVNDLMRNKIHPRWYAVRKDCVPHTRGEKMPDQIEKLLPVEYVPSAAVFLFGIELYKRSRDEELFNNVIVRTSSVCTHYNRVCVGVCNHSLLNYFDNIEYQLLGLSAALKLNQM